MGAFTLSDLPNNGQPARINWIPLAGLVLTLAISGVTGVAAINQISAKADRVDAKVDYALQQVGEVKAAQRQMVGDNREDLSRLNTKVDQLLILTAQLQQQSLQKQGR
jgi:TolA-binding protein